MSQPPAPLTDARPGEPTAQEAGSPAAREEPLAPADVLPTPSRRERFAWYAGATLAACVLVTCGMRLWERDLRAPFYYDLDALLYLPLVKTTIEKGSHWRNERMGAPGIQELYDFPVIDYLHFGCLWLLGRVFSDLLLVYNAYSLLCYPLTTLTAMWVFRWLKLSLPVAALGGLLYAFLPFHQERYQYHYFLAAYWWVPVSLVPALKLCRGEFPYFRRGPDGNYPTVSIDWIVAWAVVKGALRGSRAAWKAALAWSGHSLAWLLRELTTWRVLGPILLGVVTASAGAYYAFFACATYAFAGAYAWIVHRTWRGAASAALVILPVVATGVAYHVPTALYHFKNGRNPITDRQAHEADAYGLKLAHLLLPTTDHNFRPFANVRTLFGTPDRPADSETAGELGLIAGAGLVGLLALAVLPYRRRWPEGPLVALVVFMILLATIGAFGSIFNLLFTPQIRAYNRISIFIAFLAMFASMWWLDRFLLTRTGERMRKLRYPILAGLLVLGYFDQTPWGWNPFNPQGMAAIDAYAVRFRADKRYFQEIERSMPPGSKVFCLPYAGFPETPPVYKMATYEHARGYLMTDTLCWSYGAIKGRAVDAWQKDVTDLLPRNPEHMLERIVARGFDGLLIDGRGFTSGRDADRAAALVKRFNDKYQAEAGLPGAQLPKIVHEDGRQFFLDLRPFRDAWQKRPQFKSQEAYERDWVAALWMADFYVSEPAPDGERIIWGRPETTMYLVNPTDRTRKFEVSFRIGVDTDGPFEFTLSGVIDDNFPLDKVHGDNEVRRTGHERKYTVEIPPGRSKVRIHCRPPEHYQADGRNLCYFIREFKLKEQ